MEPHMKKKRKKRKNFLRQTKHFAKKGSYGKGKELSDDQYRYFINIFEHLRQVKGEEKELLVNNFLNGIVEEEDARKLAGNQIVSRILDDALQCGEALQVLSFTKIFSEDIRMTCLDPYASHVLQTLMALSLKFIQEQTEDKKTEDKNAEVGEVGSEEDKQPITEEQREEFVAFLNKVGRLVYNNLDEFIRDTYGSHVLRSILETCSGVQVKDSIKSSRKSQTKHSLCQNAGQILRIPSELQSLLLDIASRLMKLPDLPGIITNECGSAAFQSALLVLKGIESEQCAALIDHILLHGLANISPSYCDSYDELLNIPHVFQSNPAVRLLEVIMSCATADRLHNLYTQYFKGHIPDLVKHPIGNFAVQKLLLTWQEKEKFYELFEEAQESLEVAFSFRYTGVVHALVQACRRLEKNQGQCWKALTHLLRCYEPQDRQLKTAPCLLWFLNYDEYQKKAAAGQLPSVSLHGSLILQDFLNFIRTIKIVDSILAMNLADLQFMACDPCGSHVIDAFTSSTFIKINNKERLVNSFKGTYVALACSKHGSRSLEAMWNISSIKLKTGICEELANEEFKLKANQHGTIIYSKFMVRLFKRNDKQDWQQVVDSAAKKKRLLDDLLSDIKEEEEPKKKKKKKKKMEAS
ncbi:nucleolar protein 9 isoform X1 [Macrobrachium rosenbergii]|uniref:nucleolar protein 9 isoform X1 n=1 Tax=Macrobrachium rosenbergii TaxID=79674 RepID=UPI0034D6DE77